MAVTRPADLPKEVYGWGGPLELHRLMNNLRGVAIAFDIAAVLREPPRALLDAYYDPTAPSRKEAYELSVPIYWQIAEIGNALGLVMFEAVVLPIPPANNKSAAAVGLAVFPRVTGSITDTIPLTDSCFAASQGRVQVRSRDSRHLRPTRSTSSSTRRSARNRRRRNHRRQAADAVDSARASHLEPPRAPSRPRLDRGSRHHPRHRVDIRSRGRLMPR